eukprot:1157281-Pelagomonas_calceolata.AAC.8
MFTSSVSGVCDGVCAARASNNPGNPNPAYSYMQRSNPATSAHISLRVAPPHRHSNQLLYGHDNTTK